MSTGITRFWVAVMAIYERFCKQFRVLPTHEHCDLYVTPDFTRFQDLEATKLNKMLLNRQSRQVDQINQLFTGRLRFYLQVQL
jgi:hypothetical protein